MASDGDTFREQYCWLKMCIYGFRLVISALKCLVTCSGVLLLCAHVLSMEGKTISSKVVDTDDDVYMMPGSIMPNYIRVPYSTFSC